jgi:hypothetical protein
MRRRCRCRQSVGVQRARCPRPPRYKHRVRRRSPRGNSCSHTVHNDPADAVIGRRWSLGAIDGTADDAHPSAWWLRHAAFPRRGRCVAQRRPRGLYGHPRRVGEPRAIDSRDQSWLNIVWGHGVNRVGAVACALWVSRMGPRPRSGQAGRGVWLSQRSWPRVGRRASNEGRRGVSRCRSPRPIRPITVPLVHHPRPTH